MKKNGLFLIKEIYTLNNGKIEKIKEIGVRKKENQEISIIDVVYDVVYNNDIVKEIMATQNNHKSGKINTIMVFRNDSNVSD